MNDFPEPTPAVIAATLMRAKEMVAKGASLESALANAATTDQCDGYAGFKVYEAVRNAVDAVLPKGVLRVKFSDLAKPEDVQDVLHQAWLVVSS